MSKSRLTTLSETLHVLKTQIPLRFYNFLGSKNKYKIPNQPLRTQILTARNLPLFRFWVRRISLLSLSSDLSAHHLIQLLSGLGPNQFVDLFLVSSRSGPFGFREKKEEKKGWSRRFGEELDRKKIG